MAEEVSETAEAEQNKQLEIIQKIEGANTGDVTAEDVINYLALHADSNPAKQQEAIDLVSERTQYNKGTARNILEDEKSKKALDKFEIEKVTKIIPINEEDETVYNFHISYEDEEHQFKVESSELVTPTTFKQKILELTDQLLTIDSWNDTLNDWLDSSNVEVKEEEPLKDAHAVVEHIFNEFDVLQKTEDMGEFKQFPENFAYFEEEKDEILVSGRWIDSKVDSLNKDVSSRKIRELLDEFMPDGTAKKVRVDDDLFRAWRFKKGKLSHIGVVDTILGDE